MRLALKSLIARKETPAFVTANEREIYRKYDRLRRLRLARNIAGFLCVLVGILTVAEAIEYIISGLFVTNTGLALGLTFADLLITLILGLGFWAGLRQKVNLAASIVTGVLVLATFVFAVSENFLEHILQGNSLVGFFSLNMGIVLVGLLGDLWVIIGMTLLINVYTMLAIYVIVPTVTHQHPANALPGFPAPLIILFVQWSIGALMIAGWFNYQQTFRDLSDARAAVARAKQLDELKDQFIRSVNHELRNPLMAMMNYVTVLNQKHDLLPSHRRAAIIGSLEHTGERLIKLVDSILDTRRMTQSPKDFVPKPVFVMPMVKTAASLIDPNEARMSERDLHVNVPPQLAIWGDEVYLQQIFTNLLSNAVKYSAPGTPIEIQARPIAADEGMLKERRNHSAAPNSTVEITFHDNGVGIPPEQISLLFNRFVRLPHALTSNMGGNGLGLYLCKLLTEAMGGRIWAESSGIEGEGSTFHLLLPQAPTEDDAQADGSFIALQKLDDSVASARR